MRKSIDQPSLERHRDLYNVAQVVDVEKGNVSLLVPLSSPLHQLMLIPESRSSDSDQLMDEESMRPMSKTSKISNGVKVRDTAASSVRHIQRTESIDSTLETPRKLNETTIRVMNTCIEQIDDLRERVKNSRKSGISSRPVYCQTDIDIAHYVEEETRVYIKSLHEKTQTKVNGYEEYIEKLAHAHLEEMREREAVHSSQLEFLRNQYDELIDEERKSVSNRVRNEKAFCEYKMTRQLQQMKNALLEGIRKQVFVHTQKYIEKVNSYQKELLDIRTSQVSIRLNMRVKNDVDEEMKQRMERLNIIARDLEEDRMQLVNNLKDFIFDGNPIHYEDKSIEANEKELEKIEKMNEELMIDADTQTFLRELLDSHAQTDTTEQSSIIPPIPLETSMKEMILEANQQAWRARNIENRTRKSKRRTGKDENDSDHILDRIAAIQPPKSLKRHLRDQGIQTDNLSQNNEKQEKKDRMRPIGNAVKTAETKTSPEYLKDGSVVSYEGKPIPPLLKRSSSIFARVLLQKQNSFRTKSEEFNPIFKIQETKNVPEIPSTSITHFERMRKLNGSINPNEFLKGQRLQKGAGTGVFEENKTPLLSEVRKSASETPPNNVTERPLDEKLDVPSISKQIALQENNMNDLETKDSPIDNILAQLHNHGRVNSIPNMRLSTRPEKIESLTEPLNKEHSMSIGYPGIYLNSPKSDDPTPIKEVSGSVRDLNHSLHTRIEDEHILLDSFDKVEESSSSMIAEELFKWDANSFNEYMNKVKNVFKRRESMLREEISNLDSRVTLLQEDNLELHRGYIDVRTKQAMALLKLTKDNLALTKKLEELNQHHFDVLKGRWSSETSCRSKTNVVEVLGKRNFSKRITQSARGPKPNEETTSAEWRKFINYHPLLSSRAVLSSASPIVPVIPLREHNAPPRRVFSARIPEHAQNNGSTVALPVLGLHSTISSLT